MHLQPADTDTLPKNGVFIATVIEEIKETLYVEQMVSAGFLNREKLEMNFFTSGVFKQACATFWNIEKLT
jgi:hypothetical protein